LLFYPCHPRRNGPRFYKEAATSLRQ
jgi:hypothetical protein